MDTIQSGTKKLPILNNKIELDVDAELKQFELEQMAALGHEPGKEHWRDDNPTKFVASQRAHTTILISGLTMAHDFFLQGALRGIGYKVQAIDCPDNVALQFGKEFGNRGQCNPTYFTVGNLVKYLAWLRDEQKIPTKEIVENYVFVTAGAYGPCPGPAESFSAWPPSRFRPVRTTTSAGYGSGILKATVVASTFSSVTGLPLIII